MKTFILQVLVLRSYSMEVSAEDQDEAIESINRLNSLYDLDQRASLDWVDLDSVNVLSEEDGDDNE